MGREPSFFEPTHLARLILSDIEDFDNKVKANVLAAC